MKDSLLAQVPHPPGDTIRGLGPLSNLALNLPLLDQAVNKFNQVMSNLIGLLTVIAGLYFVFLFIGGAIAWLSAGGDKTATENAQKKITSGLLGLTIVIAGIFLIDFIGTLLGLDILSPGNFVNSVWP